MTQDEVLSRINKVVIEILKVTPEKVTRESRFKEDLGADSLDTVTLLMALEDEFKGPISDEDAAKLTTVGAAADFIAARMTAES